jgi:hypothetical protein
VTPGIVDAFEVIDVQENNGKLPVAQQRAAQAVLHAEIHLMAIRESGERIKARLELKLPIELSKIIRQPAGATVRIDKGNN